MRNVKAYCMVFVASILSCFIMAAWSPSWDRAPLPLKGLDGQGNGYCVTLYEGGDGWTGGKLIGHATVDFDRADRYVRHPEGMAVSVHNALGRIIPIDRPDLMSLSHNFRFLLPGEVPSPEETSCACTNTTWTGDPRDGGKVKGCSGPCGSCWRCTVYPEPK